MNILAVAAPIAAINPALSVIAAGGLFGLVVGCASGLKNKPNAFKGRPECSTEITKETVRTARVVNKCVEKAYQIEEKQRNLIHAETKKAKQNTRQIASCTQILNKATNSIEAQTEMSHEQLREMERLQQDLELTQQAFLKTKKKLQEQEREMAILTHKLAETGVKLDEAVKKNTKTSNAIIEKALSTQKAHQETVDPILKSKDTEIKKLTEEVLSLRRTLRQINQRLIEANGAESQISLVRISSESSTLSSSKKLGSTANQTKQNIAFGVQR